MPPKLRDFTLTATERTAITAVLQAQNQLARQNAQLEQDKGEIAHDIERRLRLPAGALSENPTHQVNVEDWRVEPILNGKPGEPDG